MSDSGSGGVVVVTVVVAVVVAAVVVAVAVAVVVPLLVLGRALRRSPRLPVCLSTNHTSEDTSQDTPNQASKAMQAAAQKLCAVVSCSLCWLGCERWPAPPCSLLRCLVDRGEPLLCLLTASLHVRGLTLRLLHVSIECT